MHLSNVLDRTNKKFSYKDYKNRQNSFLWSELNNFHPKQILEFESYTTNVSDNSCNYYVDFSTKENNIISLEKLTFSLNYKATKDDLTNKILNILKNKKDLNTIKTLSVNNVECVPISKPEIREFLYIGKVCFKYTTIRGLCKDSFKEDYRIFILNYKPTDEDLKLEFNSWLQEFNLNFPYRSLSQVTINSINTSSISNIATLKEVNTINSKDKKRVLVNKSTLNNILFIKFSLEYTNDRNKRLSGVFLLPIATYSLDNKITDKEIENIINLNRHRKVSNVKILDTTVLGSIKL